MTKYKIVKESKALPGGWEVGDYLDDTYRNESIEGRSKVSFIARTSNEHLTALFELGVVEEVKKEDELFDALTKFSAFDNYKGSRYISIEEQYMKNTIKEWRHKLLADDK